MPLSEYEQHVLDQMEQDLAQNDPKFASVLGHPKAQRSAKRIALGIVAVLIGLAGLIIGVALAVVWIGVIGFLVMFAGAYAIIVSPRRRGRGDDVDKPEADKVRPGTPKDAGNGTSTRSSQDKKKPDSRPGLTERFEQRWDRRRDSDH